MCEELRASEGAFLLSGGGFADYPIADYGSLSIGKGGLKIFAIQLNARLKLLNKLSGDIF